MTFIDYATLLLSIAFIMGVGFFFTGRAGRNSSEFLVAGRKLPWWLAGTSMIAGNFNADSALHQSRKIRQTGLPGAWFYWSQIIGQLANALVFARLWRRAEINTPVEFYQLRYHGRPAHVARIWSVCYASFIEGTTSVALGLLGLIKIITVVFDLPPTLTFLGTEMSVHVVIALIAVAAAISYSTAAGVWGVVATDIIEFAIALGCSYLLLFFVYQSVGWAPGLREGVAAEVDYGADLLRFTPVLGLAIFVWFVVSPATTLAGTNNVNQRFLALKDEKEAMFAGLWRALNHFVIRGWPWYIVGLASIILISDARLLEVFGALPSGEPDRELAYPLLVVDYMPVGLRGLMVAGFLCALMSSIDTGMHTSASIFMNDFYRPYVRPSATERHYVFVTRAAIVLYTIIGVTVALLSKEILFLLMFFIKLTSAIGLVMVLRWFWWRVNVWADLSAQIAALPVALFFEQAHRIFGPGRDPVTLIMNRFNLSGIDEQFAVSFLLIVGSVTIIWIVVMYLTPPEPDEHLAKFYTRIKPYGWWKRIARKCPDVKCPDSIRQDLTLYALSLVALFGALLGLGFFLLAHWSRALLAVAAALSAGWILIRMINHKYRDGPPPSAVSDKP